MPPSSSTSPPWPAWWFWLTAACVKLLLIPSYHSTDFEVHRHWLALTHSLPLSQWYSDTTSQWTLDYPPLFAYFEYLLSFLASLFDPTIVDIRRGLNRSTFPTLLFLRLSVITSDLSLLFALSRGRIARKWVAFVLVLWSPALMIVDHVHFQYNGFLLGILLVSLGLMEEGRDLPGGVVFAALICLKHLFAVAAPVYFVYILRHYCQGGFFKSVGRFLLMGAAVMVVIAVTFGPFIYHGQMHHVLERLFPFGRGLCHAYWAPNFWVFYIILDKGMSLVLKKLQIDVQTSSASFTGGLVGDSPSFAVLPQVSPAISLALVMLAMLPCLVQVWRFPRPKHMVRYVGYAYTCGFFFGWHVHEKASLHFVIPLSLIAADSFEDSRHYFFLAIVSCYSMFPLLFEPQEYAIKVMLLVTYALLMWSAFSPSINPPLKQTNKKGHRHSMNKDRLVGWVGMCYLLGLLGVEVWGQFLHPLVLGSNLPFFPLMLVSVYCASGMVYSWIWQLKKILQSD